MNMKAFALAVVAAAGLLCSAGTADAQWRSRGSYRTYSYPAYSYSNYSYPYTYATPTYSNGVVVTSGDTPAYGTYSPMVYPSGGYYPSTFGTPYSSSYYNGYSNYGTGVYPSGGYIGGRRAWRW